MFDFPNNPSDGDTVTHTNGNIYEYDATSGSWELQVFDLNSLAARVLALENAAAAVTSLILE
jgi:hypothetical protein